MIMKRKIEIQFNEKKKSTLIDLGVIAMIIAVVVLLAYKMNGIYPFGDATIARGDMVQQTIPAGMYYVWDILHGNASPFFTWNTGFGMNISGASSLGALLSPLNLLLFFSTRDNLVYFVNILMVLKMIGIAYSMYFYLRKYDVSRGVYILGGILYAFGAASLIHFQIMLVMEIAFFLPLIMIGIDRIFDKKGCKFFIFMLALTMIVNVYTGCITLIFIFLSSGIRIFLSMNENEEKRRCALQLGVSVLAAFLLSAVVTIPALICISNASRTGNGDFLQTYTTAIQSKWNLNEWKRVEQMVVNMALPCACILYFIVHEKKNINEKLKKYGAHISLVSLMILSVVIPGIELLWHGGSRASWPVRFIYILSFVIIDFAVLLWQENKAKEESACEKKKNWMLLCISGIAALFAGLLFYNIYHSYCQNEVYWNLGDGFLCLFIELLFAGIYFLLLKSKKKELIVTILCVELTCTSILSFAPNKDNITVFSPEYLEAANNVGTSIETEIHDFERIKNVDYKVDHIDYPLVLGQEAISNYWHVINPSLQPDFSALGYSINWTQLLDTGGTIFTDTLFHTKYYFSQQELPDELYDYCQDVIYSDTESLQLYKSKFELPFAINTNASALKTSGEIFASQNSLFQAITGSNETLIQDVSGQAANNRFVTSIGNERKILYFYGTNTSDYPITITVNGSPLIIPSSSSATNQQYPTDFCNGLVSLGTFQNEQVDVQFGGSVNMSDIHLGLLDYNTFVNGIEQIKNQNPEIKLLNQKHSGVEIELENVTKQNLFLPISYDNGWICKVNGKKVTELQNIDGMLSIPVETGRNTIELDYSSPGRKTGAILSICTFAVLAAFVWLTKKRKIEEKKVTRIAGYAAYAVFTVLFLVFFILLFDIPILYYIRSVFIVPMG